MPSPVCKLGAEMFFFRRVPAAAATPSPSWPHPVAQEAGSLCLFSFPGGKCDPADRDVVHTALRETQEELGLAVPEERVWGVLRPVHDRVSPSGLQALTPLGPSARPRIGAERSGIRTVAVGTVTVTEGGGVPDNLPGSRFPASHTCREGARGI